MLRLPVSLAVMFLLASVAMPLLAAKVKLDPSHWGLEGGKECVKCHSKTSAGIVQQWRESAHGDKGVNCLDCHQAEAGDADAIEHEGFTIATIVSPKDCARCHAQEAEQNGASVHVNGARQWGEHPLALAATLGGGSALATDCDKCHGSEVKLRGDGRLDPASWPNSGIGRVNPDGSKGSCSACHGRHAFSKADARSPSACTVCHVGLDSPDRSVFETSAHGRAFVNHRAKMNLSADQWVAGKDYAAAPTCVTCHMGAAGKLPSSHDVGLRDAWELGSPVSERQHLLVFEDGDKRNLPVTEPLPERGSTFAKIDGSEGRVKMVVPPDRRRQAMTMVCLECHAKQTVENFMTGFDSAVEGYNETYGKPAQAIMQGLYEQGLLTEAPFDEPVEISYWRLWHDAGIKARHGAAMGSPEQQWWEGFYPLGRDFHDDFLPKVRALGDQAEALIRQQVGEDRGRRPGLTAPEAASPSPAPGTPADG